MRLTLTGSLATGAVFAAAAAVGFAGLAQADPPLLNGSYTSDGGADEFLWAISTSCAPAGCAGSVTSNQGWTSPASLVDGHWDFTVTKPDGAICTDGSYAPAYISISIDPATLNGTVTTDSNYGCPGGVIDHAPFKLKQIA